MWSYYGAKTNIVDLYPAPKFPRIVEPFAGSARYSLKHFDRDVLLVDKYDIIVLLWKWLQQCSPNDILSLPRSVKMGQSLDDFTFDCIEAKWLMGFLVAKTDVKPRMKPTARQAIARPNFINYSLKRIAVDLFKIKHWEIIHGSYEDIPNRESTWFIDPPYQFGGEHYKHSNKKIVFPHLKTWARSRNGQVIVCENTKADWMDFNPLVIQRGSNKTTTEAIWTNEPTIYDNQQATIDFNNVA